MAVEREEADEKACYTPSSVAVPVIMVFGRNMVMSPFLALFMVIILVPMGLLLIVAHARFTLWRSTRP